MFTLNKIYFVLVIHLFISVFAKTYAQPEHIEDLKKDLKNTLQFDDWPGKYTGIRNGIDPSKSEIYNLVDLEEIKAGRPFIISQNEIGTFFVTYRSKWLQSENSYIEITISILNSGSEAHEYLFEYYLMGSTLPIEIKESTLDDPPIVGDVSFYEGQIFTRNNIVVKIHVVGNLATRVKAIAQELDALILAQDVLQPSELLNPRIEIDSNGDPNIIKH